MFPNPECPCDKCKAHFAQRSVTRTPPDPYATVTDNRAATQSDVTPDMDPNYQPYGTPPDSYKLARALRTLRAEDAQEPR